MNQAVLAEQQGKVVKESRSVTPTQVRDQMPLPVCHHKSSSAMSGTRTFDRHASRGVNKHATSLLEFGFTKYDFSLFLAFFQPKFQDRGSVFIDTTGGADSKMALPNREGYKIGLK